ncbi:MAG: hypothetical protein ABI594_05355 [Ginsengibacter sp.]
MKATLHSLVFFLFFLCKLSDLQAQVLVHEEARHHPVFQNDEIRMLNVLLPPGDTTQYHIHHTPSAFILFTSTITGSQLKGAAPSDGKSTAGSMYFENLSAPHLRVHRVWNMDKDTFHVMDIELLSNDTGFVRMPLVMTNLALEIDTPWVRAYRLSLSKEKDFNLHDNKRSLMLIALNSAPVQTKQNGKTQQQTLQPGSFFEIKRGQSFFLENNGSLALQFALLEMPKE